MAVICITQDFVSYLELFMFYGSIYSRFWRRTRDFFYSFCFAACREQFDGRRLEQSDGRWWGDSFTSINLRLGVMLLVRNVMKRTCLLAYSFLFSSSSFFFCGDRRSLIFQNGKCIFGVVKWRLGRSWQRMTVDLELLICPVLFLLLFVHLHVLFPLSVLISCERLSVSFDRDWVIHPSSRILIFSLDEIIL